MMKKSILYRSLLALFLLGVFVGSFAKQNKEAEADCAALCNATAYGPEKFLRTTGAKNEYSTTITIPAGLIGPFNLHIQNGEADGTNRISSATVIIKNGQSILVQSDLNQNVASVEKCVMLAPVNTMDIVLASKPGSYLIISICGKGDQPPVDNTPPVINPSLSPLPNTYGWNNTPVTVSFACFDAQSGVAQCPSPTNVTVESSAFVVSGTAIDNAGNSASASATVKLDRTVPQITLTSPANGEVTNKSMIVVHGSVTDNLSGVATVVCNGVAAIISGTLFTANVRLSAGIQQIVCTATDTAGNSASSTITLTVDTNPPMVVITSPANGFLTNKTPTAVTWTIDGITQTTQLIENLVEGTNTITRSATDAAGNTGTASITVTLDSQAPVVVITSPANGFLTNKSLVVVTWTVDGIEQTVQLTKNLVEGGNTITRTSTDAAGNVGSASVIVTLGACQ